MFKRLFIVASILFSALSFAQDNVRTDGPGQFISHVEVTPLGVSDLNAVVLPSDPTDAIKEIAMILDGLLAIGKKIWPIIEANRPVINTAGLVPALSVVPQFDGNGRNVELYQMANWSAPRAISYRISYKNLLGMEVVGFTYTVFFQYNGSLNNVGKYITSLKVQASEVSADWGFNFDANSELVSIANVGTSLDPVASAIIMVSYKARGLLNEIRNSQAFYVDGAGNIKVISQQ